MILLSSTKRSLPGIKLLEGDLDVKCNVSKSLIAPERPVIEFAKRTAIGEAGFRVLLTSNPVFRLTDGESMCRSGRCVPPWHKAPSQSL